MHLLGKSAAYMTGTSFNRWLAKCETLRASDHKAPRPTWKVLTSWALVSLGVSKVTVQYEDTGTNSGLSEPEKSSKERSFVHPRCASTVIWSSKPGVNAFHQVAYTVRDFWTPRNLTEESVMRTWRGACCYPLFRQCIASLPSPTHTNEARGDRIPRIYKSMLFGCSVLAADRHSLEGLCLICLIL